MTRRVLLVGSLPFDDEASAMARAIELVGDRLISVPDGETGDRSDQYPSGDRYQWVAGLAGRLAGESSLFDAREPGTMNEKGFPVDFDSAARPLCTCPSRLECRPHRWTLVHTGRCEISTCRPPPASSPGFRPS